MNKTLLDEFAMAAMDVFAITLPAGHTWSYETIAEETYNIAEAMLIERKRRNSDKCAAEFYEKIQKATNNESE